MFKVIIIEDEGHAADLLEKMLYDIDPSIEVLEKAQDLPSGVRSIKRHAPEVVFLDIELPVYSGIQLLDFFNPEELNFHIVFTTAFSEYAVRAFEMSAIDYLMKPLQQEKLAAAVKKIAQNKKILSNERLPVLKENLQAQNNRKIVVPVSNGFEILSLSSIAYLKAEGSYTHIAFANGQDLLVSKNLRHFEYILSDVSKFVRIHRSFIANIDFAKKIIRKDGSALQLENKAELPIAEDRMEKLLALLQTL
jgi:two-component system LytT family response regulator